MGRLMARNDIILALRARLQLSETLRQPPEILDQQIVAPMVSAALPGSGTSILFELLPRGPDVGVHLTLTLIWEAIQACSAPEACQLSYYPED